MKKRGNKRKVIAESKTMCPEERERFYKAEKKKRRFINIVQKKEIFCSIGKHEFCTLSKKPIILICLNCGKMETDLSNLSKNDFDLIETNDRNLAEEKIDLYR